MTEYTDEQIMELACSDAIVVGGQKCVSFDKLKQIAFDIKTPKEVSERIIDLISFFEKELTAEDRQLLSDHTDIIKITDKPK